MNFRQIEKLLERYFNGETSLEEEKILKDFFKGGNIPPHLLSLKKQFEYFADEQKNNYLDERFDHKVLDQITQNEKSNTRSIKLRRLYTYSSIAASIIIVLSIFFKFDPFSKKMDDTFNDPQIAYEETKKALLFVSKVLNKGISPVEKVASFDEGSKQMSKLSSMNKGIEEANKISTFYEKQ